MSSSNAPDWITGMTPRMHAVVNGKKAAAARMKSLTPKQRSEISRKAALARHAKKTPEERSEHARRMGKAAQAKRTPALRTHYGRLGGEAFKRKHAGRSKFTRTFKLTEDGLQRKIEAGRRVQASRSPELRSELGRMGGTAAMAKLTPEQRRQGASRAAIAANKKRWAGHKKKAA